MTPAPTPIPEANEPSCSPQAHLQRCPSPPPLTLADYAREAKARLAPEAWAFFEGGAGDEVTVSANQAAWNGIWLRPRVLQSQVTGHSRVHLLGHDLEWPVLVAPIAHQRWAHPEGEMASAVAASALGAGFMLSTQSNTPMEQVMRAYRGASAPRAGLAAFQLYLQRDRNQTLNLVRRAEDCGYDAIVLTVDAPVQGVRDRERHHGSRLPEGLRAVHLPADTSPATPCETNSGTSYRSRSSGFTTMDELRRRAPTWDDVIWLLRATHLPVLLKGILHPDDAQHARDMGAAGVIVSNHGGRTLDTALPTALALAPVRAAVGPAYPVLVDGGLRRGTDIFKALALGANAVLVGRPCIQGLAHSGAHGVAAVLRMLRDEFEAAQILCGCATPDDIGPQHLYASAPCPGAATIRP